MLHKPSKVQSVADAVPLVTAGKLFVNLCRAACIFWLLLGYALWPQFQESLQLTNRGVLTTATVETVVSHPTDDGPSSQLCYAYQASAGPSAPRPQRFERCEEIEWTAGQMPEVGAGITVLYVNGSPQVARLLQNVTSPIELFGDYLRAFTLILLLLGCLTVIPSLSLLRQSAHLVQEGRIASGQIVARGVTYAGAKAYYVAYAFPGSPIIRQWVDLQRFHNAQVGDPVKVRFLPANPRLSHIEWC